MKTNKKTIQHIKTTLTAGELKEKLGIEGKIVNVNAAYSADKCTVIISSQIEKGE